MLKIKKAEDIKDTDILCQKAESIGPQDLFDLDPINGRNSFYGKAKYGEFDYQGKLYDVLFSYNTLICIYDADNNILYRTDYWDYSMTTRIHQRAFLSKMLGWDVKPRDKYIEVY